MKRKFMVHQVWNTTFSNWIWKWG